MKLGSLERELTKGGLDIFLIFWHFRHFRAISLWKKQGPFRPWSFWWGLKKAPNIYSHDFGIFEIFLVKMLANQKMDFFKMDTFVRSTKESWPSRVWSRKVVTVYIVSVNTIVFWLKLPSFSKEHSWKIQAGSKEGLSAPSSGVVIILRDLPNFHLFHQVHHIFVYSAKSGIFWFISSHLVYSAKLDTFLFIPSSSAHFCLFH